MTEELPFIEVEPDLRLALQICASRTSLSGTEFADLLTRLMSLCRKQGYLAAKAARRVETPEELSHAEEVVLPMRVPPDSTKEKVDLEAFKDPNRPVILGYQTNPKEKMRQKGLPEQDKAIIRKRYADAEKNANGRIVQRGWFRQIAKEYNRKVSYIYRVIYHDPQYEAIPKGVI